MFILYILTSSWQIKHVAVIVPFMAFLNSKKDLNIMLA